MRFHFSLRLSAAAATLAVLASSQANVTFSTFVSGSDINAAEGQNNTIGFAYAGDRFVGSVYYGTNNNQLYQTDLNGNNVKLFGGTLTGGTGELYVSSSLGSGGFGSRDVFAGFQDATNINMVSHDGSVTTNNFSTGFSGGIRSINFDYYGDYGYQALVATASGNIYTMNAAGSNTLLNSVGEDTEGIGFTPQSFGSFSAGTAFIASEGSGHIRAIAPNGALTDTGIVIGGAEMISFVPLDLGKSGNPVEGFYAANYADNIIKADASQWTPYIGDMVVTSETNHQVYDVHWDGTQFVTSSIGQFPSQPEDGIFVTNSLVHPVPEPAPCAAMVLGILGLAKRRRK